jgi:hypothetical protein
MSPARIITVSSREVKWGEEDMKGRTGGLEGRWMGRGRIRDSAKVQIGAELLCKSVTHAVRERDRVRGRAR